MDILRKYWPTPFKVQKGDIASLIIQLVIFIVVCAIFGWLIGVLASIPVVGIIFSLIGSLVEIYGLVGIVLCVLKFIGTIN